MANHILDTIGNTPLVPLKFMSPNPDVTILVKLEYFNPTLSIKDRIVKHIIEDAEQTGALKPGGTIVENSSGNTGTAVAMIAAAKGYKAIITAMDKVSTEKLSAITAFGAELVVCPTAVGIDSPEHYENRARKIAEETPNSFHVNQYNTPKNPEAHYLSTGPEIWEQTNGDIDYFVASGSTGGTISGVGKYLKEQNPNIQTLLADPYGSVYYDYHHTGEAKKVEGCTYHIEGVGEDYIVDAIDFSVIDDVVQFDDQQAFSTARQLARREGICGGGSGGANVWAAIELAKTLERPATIVTVIPDSGNKYLSKMFNDEWMLKNNLSLS